MRKGKGEGGGERGRGRREEGGGREERGGGVGRREEGADLLPDKNLCDLPLRSLKLAGNVGGRGHHQLAGGPVLKEGCHCILKKKSY
jgi:hypothetical protein